MAEMAITTGLEDLRVLFNQMKEVYFISKTNADISTLATVDMEIPVLEDGVTFNTGDADITKVKLTTGATWTAVASAGDSDVQFQVPSVAGAINELFLNKKTDAAITMTATLGGKTYSGNGYDIQPKRATGGLLMRSEDRSSVLFLPNVEMYSSLVSEQDKPAYFNVSVTPLEDANGAAIYIMTETE